MKKPINKNVALIELGGSHTECMHLQIYALKKHAYNVFLICNESLFNDFPDKNLFSGYQLHSFNSSIKSQISTVLKVRKFLKQNDINTVVFNTSEITIVRNLLIFSLPKVKNYIGIVHNGKYLESSSTFKLMSKKMKKYFVLSNDIKKGLNSMQNIEVESFYPIYFPCYSKVPLEKKENSLWITVPGSMSPKRKDLSSLLNAIEKKTLNSCIQIILLGALPNNEYPEIMDRIMQLSKTNNIVLFNTRISNEVFASYIEKSDLIMPLVHPGTNDFYGEYRISGAYNLAYGYKIPLLLEESLSTSDDFSNIALYYNTNNIVERLNEIADNKAELFKCKEALLTHSIYNLENQVKAYINFLQL